MQSILRKRVVRDLKENLFRYLALGVLIIFCMYLIVSMISAAETIMTGSVKYGKETKVEDGEFSVFVPLKKSEVRSLKKDGVILEEAFYMDYSVGKNTTVRVFQNREKINLVKVEQGHLAKKDNEIVLDKRYCAEKNISLDDTIKIGGERFTVCGIGCSADYDAPYKNLTDVSVDSTQFGTAFVTKEAYAALKAGGKSEKAEEYVYVYRLKKGMTHSKFKERLKENEVDASAITDTYFQEYWEETGKKKDDLMDGVDDLYDGSRELSDGLLELDSYKKELNDGAEQMLDAVLAQAEEGLSSYGLKGTLTADNYREKINALLKKSDSGLFRMEVRSVLQQLDALKEYKDGIASYTKNVKKAVDGAEELSDGVKELKDGAEELIDKLTISLSNLTQFVKASDNPRIGAASEDQVINKVAGLIAGVIIIILFAYVISVFVVHGIERESSVIGALYALGVTRRDLLLHYLTLPVFVTFLGSVIGTLIGYSPIGIESQMADAYQYFSIPKFSYVYAPYLLVYALVMPVVIAALVNWIVIRKKLSRPVLALMRKEAKEPRVRKVQLGNRKFVTVFRIRQMLRELRTSFTVVFGLFICMLIAMLALDCYVMCSTVEKESVRDTKFEYMYTYKYPEKEAPEGGTACYAKTLKREKFGNNLDVTLLGLTKDNPYFDADVKKGMNRVILSSAAAQKYQLKKGDKIVLTDEEEDRDYTFTVDGVTEYSTGLYVFMNIDSMRELFSESDDYYNVVFSDHALSIPSGRLYSVLTKSQVKKSSNIFITMMMPMIYTLITVSVVIFCVVMYLMMKVMIDRSSFGISLIKIFGYRIGEIRKLYLNGNFYVVAIGTAICMPLAKLLMDAMYPLMVSNVASGCNTHFTWQIYAVVYVAILLLYFVINHFLVGQLRKVLPAEVLKNRE